MYLSRPLNQNKTSEECKDFSMDFGYSFWLLLTKIHGFGARLRLRNESGLAACFNQKIISPIITP